MKLRTYRAFQAMILAGLGFFLLNRYWAGQLIVYIHQRYVWLVLPAALVLLAIAYTLFNQRPPIRSDEDSFLAVTQAPPGSNWRLLMMLIPLVLGVMIPIAPLGAEAAGSRQVNRTLSFSSDPYLTEKVLALDPGTRSIMEWLWAFDAAVDKRELNDQPVSLEGFVLIREDLPEDQFLVARFVISCCVADATAVGIAVQPPDQESNPTDGWVRITGQMQVITQETKETLLIQATVIQSIEMPEQPYLYQ